MRAVFDRKELLVLLRDFYELTGIRAVVFDEWGMDILSYPGQLPRFCRLVRSTRRGELGCRVCDQQACYRAKQEKRSVIYPCHAGLIEIITPIRVDDVIVGYLLLSHIVQGADEAAEWALARAACREYGLEEGALRAAYDQLPRTPYPILKAAADLLTLAAAALYQARLARLVPGSAADRLHRFLTEHLAEPLPSARVCETLGVGRTRLFALARETYGCGLAEQVARMRVRRAMELLATTEMTNSQICEAVGIPDYNYFFRVFRRQTGLTPRAYRQNFREIHIPSSL